MQQLYCADSNSILSSALASELAGNSLWFATRKDEALPRVLTFFIKQVSLIEWMDFGARCEISESFNLGLRVQGEAKIFLFIGTNETTPRKWSNIFYFYKYWRLAWVTKGKRHTLVSRFDLPLSCFIQFESKSSSENCSEIKQSFQSKTKVEHSHFHFRFATLAAISISISFALHVAIHVLTQQKMFISGDESEGRNFILSKYKAKWMAQRQPNAKLSICLSQLAEGDESFKAFAASEAFRSGVLQWKERGESASAAPQNE